MPLFPIELISTPSILFNTTVYKPPFLFPFCPPITAFTACFTFFLTHALNGKICIGGQKFENFLTGNEHLTLTSALVAGSADFGSL